MRLGNRKGHATGIVTGKILLVVLLIMAGGRGDAEPLTMNVELKQFDNSLDVFRISQENVEVEKLQISTISPILYFPNPMNWFSQTHYDYSPDGSLSRSNLSLKIQVINKGGAGLVLVKVNTLMPPESVNTGTSIILVPREEVTLRSLWVATGNDTLVINMSTGADLRYRTWQFSALSAADSISVELSMVCTKVFTDIYFDSAVPPPSASYVNVDDNFTDNLQNHQWNTIMKGIGNVKEGGTVYVNHGTYYENVEAYKKLILKGNGMPIINAQGSGSPIKVSADGITIDGFYVTGSSNSYPNAGISVLYNNNFIVNNTAENNFKGIYLAANNNTIAGNNISFNRNTNISDGIYGGSDNNTIMNNVIIGNWDEGIQIGGNNNVFIGNTIASNSNAGIELSGSFIFYHNNIINNTIYQSEDSNQSWNFNREGNYWSDYTGSDTNGDGIGDTPYYIQGGSKDNYPFMKQNGWISENITPVPPPTSTPPTSVIKGDVSGDGQVTVVDALFVAQYTVGIKTLTSAQLAAADVSGDSQVTVVDALFIAQYTVGLRQSDFTTTPTTPVGNLNPFTSQGFQNGGYIPTKYTCNGQDVSPSLSWGWPPAGTKSLALLLDDPDAGDFSHWVLYNLPASVKSLPEGVQKIESPASGGIQGTNDFGGIGYGGPCPPPGGPHTYRFILYALDSQLNPVTGTRQGVLNAMQGHVLTQAELDGEFGT